MGIDILVAQKLLAKEVDPPVEWLQVLSTLSEKTREGHLFIETDVPLPPLKGVVRVGNRLYLERNFKPLNTVEERLKSLTSVDPIPIHGDLPLTDEQRGAIEKLMASSVSFLFGGPGTGKTYTAGWLVRILAPHIKTVALAAPTGKAARTLRASIERVLGAEKGLHIKAMTLHALLGRDNYPLHDDLIIVDESSMIDLQMMAKLFTKVRPTSRLILMGDPDQLPPIEEGSLFADLAPLGTLLTKSLRMGNVALQGAASSIRRGEMPKFDEEVVTFREILNPFEALKTLVQEAVGLFPQEFTNHEESFQALDQFRLLASQKMGPLGVDSINRALFIEMAKRRNTLLPLPIMITKNDYTQDLFNGECGLLVVSSSECQRGPDYPLKGLKGAYALFQTSLGLKQFEVSHLPPFTLAWCLSIHKSQGSEFKRVRLLLPDTPPHACRELLYTGLTRAKAGADIWSSLDVLNTLLSRSCQRESGLICASSLP